MEGEPYAGCAAHGRPLSGRQAGEEFPEKTTGYTIDKEAYV